MKKLAELLPGCWLLQPRPFEDERGLFVKSYQAETFRDLGLEFSPREEFYSLSRRGVLRGMHFQTPPHAQQKLIFCLSGGVRDVLVDLRPGPGYGRCASVELSAENRLELFLPVGVGHGFLALSESALMVYKTSVSHAPDHDRGVLWNSFGFDWGCDEPVLSARDRLHPALAEFATPF